MTTRPIGSIIVGRRHRRDMGDIAALAASIEDIGLLNPITVDSDGNLLAGGRRLAVCKRLGLQKIPVNIVEVKNGARLSGDGETRTRGWRQK